MSDDEKREQELILRAAFINGAEWATNWLGAFWTYPIPLTLIEEAFSKWKLEGKE
jgi:hypothetical protein